MTPIKTTLAQAKDDIAGGDGRQVARTSSTIGLLLLGLSLTPIAVLLFDLVLLIVPTLESKVILPRPNLQGFIVLFCVLTGSIGAALVFGAGEDGPIQRSSHPRRVVALASLYGVLFASLLLTVLIWIGSLHFDRAII